MQSNEILERLNFTREEANTLGLLVIGNELFTTELTKALLKLIKDNTSKLFCVTCANIEELLYHTNKLHIDSAIFILDTGLSSCATDVEFNLQRMDESFLCGRTYVVNATPHIPGSETNVDMNTIIALTEKYGVHLLNGNIMDPKSCDHLAQRLLTVIRANLGIQPRTPLLPLIFQKN